MRHFTHLFLIATLGIIVYSNTFDVPFQFDDEIYIIENPIIKDFSYFTEPSKAVKFRFDSNVPIVRKTRSVAYFTFLANYKAHGLNLTGYHAANLLIHVLNTFLVYFLVILTFKTLFLRESSLKDHSQYIALFTGLLFVSHPLHTQAVTYICQRFASLVSFFYLLSVLAYVRSRLSDRNAQKYAFYALSLISAILAMKTKENAFTLPLAIALYEFIFFKGDLKRRAVYLLPLFLTMLIIPLTVINMDKPLGEAIGEATRTHLEISRWDYLLTEFRVIVTYIRLLFLPVNQNLDYDYPVYHSFIEPAVFLSFLFLVSVLGIGVYLLYRSRITDYGLRLVSFGIFWFFITLLVESSVIPIVDIIFEHRAYLPSVGAFTAVTSSAFLLVGRARSGMTKKAALAGFIIALLVLSLAVYTRNNVWRSEIGLWEDTARKSPGKARPHTILGISYGKLGRYDDALREYRAAMRANPDYTKDQGLEEAIIRYMKELEKYDEEESEHLAILKIDPGNAAARNNLGIIYDKLGRYDEAVKEYLAALRISPESAEVHNNLGIVYGKMGRHEEAEREYRAALDIKPEYAEAHNNLGVIYFNTGRLDEALREYKTELTYETMIQKITNQ
jgi:Flp pilus assembly protein TadD